MKPFEKCKKIEQFSEVENEPNYLYKIKAIENEMVRTGKKCKYDIDEDGKWCITSIHGTIAEYSDGSYKVEIE